MVDPEADLDYWRRVREFAAITGSDGCSRVTNFHRDCCLEHDIAYKIHATLDGQTLTKAEADQRFFNCMARRSRAGYFNPMAWWRYYAVRWFGPTW